MQIKLFVFGGLNGTDVRRVSRVLFVQRLSLSVIVPCGQQQEGLLRSLTSSDVSRPREETSVLRAEAFAREKSGRNDPPRRGARRIRKRHRTQISFSAAKPTTQLRVPTAGATASFE